MNAETAMSLFTLVTAATKEKKLWVLLECPESGRGFPRKLGVKRESHEKGGEIREKG